MAVPRAPQFNPNRPIPNDPFYSPLAYYVQGVWGPTIVGSGLNIDYIPGTINATGGGGGAVSQIIAGAGIAVSPAGGTGAVTVSLVGSGIVADVTASTPLQSTGGVTPNISMVTSGVFPGSYTNPTITVDIYGRVTSATNGGGSSNTTVTAPITNTGTTSAPVIGICTATTGQLGAVQLASTADTQAGTSGTLAVTPAGAAATYVPCCAYTAKGTILGGTAAGAFAALPLGATNQLLRVNTSCTTGLEWFTECFLNDSIITAKGTLVTGTAASTPVALPVGNDTQVLVADSACASGLKWGPPGSVPDATPLLQGSMYGCTRTTDGGVALGYRSGSAGSSNVSVGYFAATGSTSYNNVAVGSCAGRFMTTGNSNVFVGAQAATILTTGSYNTFVGTCSGNGPDVTGSRNTALGFDAGAGAGANVAIGWCAGGSLTAGVNNVLVGPAAGVGITTGTYNTIVGACAGQAGPGTGNTMIGENAGGNASIFHDYGVYIGNNAGASQISVGCGVFIGSSTFNTPPFIAGPSTIVGTRIQGSHENCAVYGYGGGVCAKFSLCTGIAWDFVSDSRVKDGVTALPVKAESFINALRPVSYCFLNRETKEPLENKHCNVGFIAQEVEEAMEKHGLGEITSIVQKPRGEDDYYSLTDAGFTPFVVKAIQELSAKVAALEAKLAELT